VEAEGKGASYEKVPLGPGLGPTVAFTKSLQNNGSGDDAKIKGK
jgi:hypothetical protein